jgi:hypothetical protein
MADSAAFTWVCDQLQRATPLSEIEVRGTVRLALKQAGLEARSVSGAEMAVLLTKVMPLELQQRAVGNATQVCEDLTARIQREHFAEAPDAKSVESVFRRLGGATS